MNPGVGCAGPVAGMPPVQAEAIAVRLARASDRVVLPRLVAFGLPPWRDPCKALAIDRAALAASLRRLPARGLLLAAEQQARPVGFIQVLVRPDPAGGGPLAQVARILVLRDEPAPAIVRALLAAARRRLRARGCVRLTCGAWWAMATSPWW